LKKAYGKGAWDSTILNKLDFPKVYSTAHQNVFTPQSIQSGFAAEPAAGLSPFKPNMVPETLIIKLATPTTPRYRGGSSISSSQLATPHTIRRVHRKAFPVKKLLRKSPCSPSSPSKQALDEFIKGCELAIYNASLLARKNSDVRTAIRKIGRRRADLSARWLPQMVYQFKKQGNSFRQEMSNRKCRGGIKLTQAVLLFQLRSHQNVLHQGVRNVILRDILEPDVLIVIMIS
jgi:hypothetical protein